MMLDTTVVAAVHRCGPISRLQRSRFPGPPPRALPWAITFRALALRHGRPPRFAIRPDISGATDANLARFVRQRTEASHRLV